MNFLKDIVVTKGLSLVNLSSRCNYSLTLLIHNIL